MEQVLPEPPEDWVNLAALANELERYYPTLREFLKRLPETEYARVARATGGQPEWWVSLPAAEELRKHYRRIRRTAGAGAAAPVAAAAPTMQQPRPTMANLDPTMAAEPSSLGEWLGSAANRAQDRPTMGEAPMPKHEASVEQERPSMDQASPRLDQERSSMGQDRSSLEQAWEAALRQAERRAETAEMLADTLRDERDRLLDETDGLRERVGELERRTDVAETQVRRAREDSDRFRGELERTRIAWHQWRGGLAGEGRWRLWSRRFPAEPPEFTAGPALSKPVDD